jgi:hypothetical protein
MVMPTTTGVRRQVVVVAAAVFRPSHSREEGLPQTQRIKHTVGSGRQDESDHSTLVLHVFKGEMKSFGSFLSNATRIGEKRHHHPTRHCRRHNASCMRTNMKKCRLLGRLPSSSVSTETSFIKCLVGRTAVAAADRSMRPLLLMPFLSMRSFVVALVFPVVGPLLSTGNKLSHQY